MTTGLAPTPAHGENPEPPPLEPTSGTAARPGTADLAPARPGTADLAAARPGTADLAPARPGTADLAPPATAPGERAATEEVAVWETVTDQEAPPALAGDPILAIVDAAACGLLAFLGASLAATLDPWRLGSGLLRGAATVPFPLAGLLGVGAERGRWAPSVPGRVRVAVTLGAATGALVGALAFEAPIRGSFRGLDPLVLAVRVLPLVLLGPLLAAVGTRLARAPELWREAARAGPPTATPRLAARIAAWRVPALVRVVLAPIGLVGLAFGVLGAVAIRAYQITLSRLMPASCRFEPSCSRYGLEAYWRHGAWKGSLLTAYRVGRCQPFCEGGHDPVPPASAPS